MFVKLIGTSLMPLAKPGDILWLSKVYPSGWAPGELVVFDSGGGFTAHRVIQAIRKDSGIWLQTAGQKARIPDSWIRDSEIIGRVVGIFQGSDISKLRQAPSGLRARVWAWRARLQCLLHELRVGVRMHNSK